MTFSLMQFQILEGVYMKPKMKSTRSKISGYHKTNSVYITLHCGQNEMNFVSGSSEINGPLSKSQSFLTMHV